MYQPCWAGLGVAVLGYAMMRQSYMVLKKAHGAMRRCGPPATGLVAVCSCVLLPVAMTPVAGAGRKLRLCLQGVGHAQAMGIWCV